MMTKCPECGSSDIIPDLLVNTDAANPNHKPTYVKLLESPPEECRYGTKGRGCQMGR